MKTRQPFAPMPRPAMVAETLMERLLQSESFNVVPGMLWPKTRKFTPHQVWCNNRYMVFETGTQDSGSLGALRHLMIRPPNLTHPGWAELFKIKNELIGPDAWAMEVHPPADRLVDDAPMYHLWVITDPELIPRTRI
jgi:hypothetical protein